MADLSEIMETMEPTVLASGYGRTEGPLWHPGGYATFVDLENSRLLRWDTNGEVSVVREGTGEGNGCTFDRNGNLIMCEGADHRRVTRMDAAGNVTVVAERWDGKRFHKPNDVICRSDGTLYFTDPGLRLPAELREMDFAGVFRVDPQGDVHLATDQCVYPNGLALSPDESVLYVAISRAEEADLEREERGEFCPNRRIEAFDVAAGRDAEQPPGVLRHGFRRSGGAGRDEGGYGGPGVLRGFRGVLGHRAVGGGGWRGANQRGDPQPGLRRGGQPDAVHDAGGLAVEHEGEDAGGSGHSEGFGPN